MKQMNSLLAVKYLSKGKSRIRFLTFGTAQFQMKANFLSLRCHSQIGVTHQSGQLKLSTFWPLGGNDALITYSRYIMSKQFCEQVPKNCSSCDGLQGCRMCREQEVHREELTAGRTWPCPAGWENWSFFSRSEWCCLNPICPDPPVLRWPALECTCSIGPGSDEMHC